MAILQKLVSHGGKRLSLYADKGCHLRKMAALLFPEESSTILRLLASMESFVNFRAEKARKRLMPLAFRQWHLYRFAFMVTRWRFELQTHCLKGNCSAN